MLGNHNIFNIVRYDGTNPKFGVLFYMKKLIAILVTLISCTSPAQDFKVAVFYWSMNIEGQVAMRKGLESEAEKINASAKEGSRKVKLVPYVAGDGASGVENQIKQMNEAIDKGGIDLIIVQPTNNAALIGPLLKANKKKIPVVAYDQYIVEGELASYVTSNNYQAGYLNGEYIDSLYPNNFEIKLILVEYPEVSSTVERVDGFLDALKKAKQKFKIMRTYLAVEPVGGALAGEKILKDFPEKNSIDVVFTINDGGGLAVVEKIAKAGRSEIKFATIDGDPKSVENIKKSNLTVIDSAQFCAEIGRQSIKVGYRILKGEKVPKKILVPTFPITKESMHLYEGWLGNVPNSFEKPWKKGNFWNNKYKEFN